MSMAQKSYPTIIHPLPPTICSWNYSAVFGSVVGSADLKPRDNRIKFIKSRPNT